jgi:hypothetical protein
MTELVPRRHPGRADRKAAAFAAEVIRLRAEGYTYEAIREALADVGVELSTSTLRREVRRLPKRVTAGHPEASLNPVNVGQAPPKASKSAVATDTESKTHASSAGPSYVGDPRKGRAIAESFMNGRVSNPLVRERIEDEARRDQLLRQRR